MIHKVQSSQSKLLVVDVSSLSATFTALQEAYTPLLVNAASQFKSLCQDLPRLLELFLGGSSSASYAQLQHVIIITIVPVQQ